MNKLPRFIESENTSGARIGKEYVGITGNGAITIYAGFFKKKGIKSFTKCKLLIDKEQGLIGLQFGNDELGQNAYTLMRDNESEPKTAYINASNFFINNDLQKNEWYGRYEPEKYESPERPNVYMIDLDKKISINRKTRNKASI